MTRAQSLWLFIWIFIFFLIFCIANKLQHIPAHTQEATQNALPVHTQKVQKEMYLKILKDADKVTLSGIVATQDDKEQIRDAYGKVFHTIDSDDLHVDTQVKPNQTVEFFTNIADNFSHFDSGLITYNNGTLEVDGTTKESIVSQNVQEQLSLLKGIEISNKLLMHDEIQEEEKEAPVSDSTAAITPPSIQTQLDTMLRDKRVQFLYARDILTSGSKMLVDKLISVLKTAPDAQVEISGHTDSDGSKENNLRLSQKRAQSVKDYMVSRGLNPKNIRAVGYGESRPLTDNKTLENRQKNRRVEFTVIGEK